MIPLLPIYAGQKYESSSAMSASNALSVFIKSAYEAYIFGGSVLTKIVDADYPGWKTSTVTSMVRVGGVVTVTVPSPTNWQSGSTVTVSGATQPEYNGDHVITVTSSTTFTFPISTSPATPATGSISVKGGRTTVPGIAYLDGYFFVMDENATIYNSGINNPASWNALDFITANIEPGSGVALTKSQNYVIALKSWSTEFFYDAANPVGSPLSPVMSAFTMVGCASGDSVAAIDNTVTFISKTKQKGRAIHSMVGHVQEKISSPDIDRILNEDSLEDVSAFGVKVSGHAFYVLTLRNSGITLVYDFVSKVWGQWTSLTPRTGKSCSLTGSGKLAHLYCHNHGVKDGDPITVSGATETSFNGNYQALVVDEDNINYLTVSDLPATTAGAVVVIGYDESYFKYSHYAFCAGADLVLHETSGEVCEFSESHFSDSGNPINFMVRTQKFDNGNDTVKSNPKIGVIGNKVGGMATIRWSDDDYATNSKCRPVDLSSDNAKISRCGKFRRRSFELRHVGDSAVQVSSLELEIK